MTHLGDAISAYLDGEMDAIERDRADTHLADCARCSEDLATIAAVRERVRTLPVLEPGRRRTVAPRRPWTLAAASVAAVALAAGLVLAGGEAPATFDLGTLNDQHTARVVGDPGVSTLRGNAP